MKGVMLELRNNLWKPKFVCSFNMGNTISINILSRALKRYTNYDFHGLFSILIRKIKLVIRSNLKELTPKIKKKSLFKYNLNIVILY